MRKLEQKLPIARLRTIPQTSTVPTTNICGYVFLKLGPGVYRRVGSGLDIHMNNPSFIEFIIQYALTYSCIEVLIINLQLKEKVENSVGRIRFLRVESRYVFSDPISVFLASRKMLMSPS